MLNAQNPSGPQSIIQAKEAIYFFIAMFYFVSGLLWELFGSTKIQSFNDIKDNEGNIIVFMNITEPLVLIPRDVYFNIKH